MPPCQPADVELLVIGAGGQPGPDAAAVAREIAARLPPGHPGRVLLAVHTNHPEPSLHPVPAHRVGPILLDWSVRGLSWAQTRAELDAVRARLSDLDGADALREAGVEVASGRVHFLGRGRVAIDPAIDPAIDVGHDPVGRADPQLLTPSRVVLATGSAPRLPDVPGIRDVAVHTASTVLDLPELPGSMVVLGAGSLGCELAQGFARLGVLVTLVDRAPAVLPGGDPETSSAVERALRGDGVRLLLGATVEKVAPTLDGGAWVGTDVGGDVAAEAFVVATGRRPRVAGLDLAAAGIELSPDGVVLVDDRLRTTADDVLAAGEVTGLVGYAAAPGPMARVVAVNAVSRRAGLRWALPVAAEVTRTDPQVVRIGTWDDDGSCGSSGGPTADSLVQVRLGAPSGRGVLGLGGPSARHLEAAVLVGPGAAEAAGHLVLAVNAGLPAAALIDTVATDGTWAAAIQVAVARALTGG